MANKMLIDASHPEETRVVVLRGNRVEEFDFESASKKQLRGNIYLAKVTRVEPSLQAAFVDYGGNRHGFLAFSEIHPDYYQIPVVDRQALIEDEANAQRDEEDEDARTQRRSRRFRRDRNGRHTEKRSSHGETLSEAFDGAPDNTADAAGKDAGDARVAMREAGESLDDADFDAPDQPNVATREDIPHEHDFAHDPERQSSEHIASESIASNDGETLLREEHAEEPDAQGDASPRRSMEERAPHHRENADEDGEDDEDHVEQLGGDAMEEVPTRPHRYRKQYKIQEVIKRRQVLLVQVVKEERGNKGAALTTYLSLAGRYSVLMPNTARGGGISRKITDSTDRQRLKSIAQELEVPEGMGVILRTAGASRTKAEVKRDFEYLLRMWETVRETTLQSTAPTLVYEEGSLIKRAIRDLYNKDIEEIVVAGESGYHEAKEFMRLLMPSHSKSVQAYRDPQPIFAKSGAEAQLDAMFLNQVTLKSGGYIVINQTEALVAIDVNSGRSTREHNIEDTALRTNLEAADEITRQLRLRDLAGLIVIDFIDMEESRNNRAVERRLKDALKNDRARIQVGRISHFGLLEMSRQRIRTGVLEGSTEICPHCVGSGMLRSTSSIALHVLRILEDALIKSASHDLIINTRTVVALYILNQKRAHLRELERRFGVSVTIAADDSLIGAIYYALQRGELATGGHEPLAAAPSEPSRVTGAVDDFSADVEDETETAAPGASSHDADDDEAMQNDGARREGESESDADNRRKRRRRRRRGRGGDREGSGIAANAPQPPDDALAAIANIGGLQPIAAVEAETAQIDATPTEIEIETEAAPVAIVAEATPPPERRRPRRGGRARDAARTPAAETSSDSAPELTLDLALAAPSAEIAANSEPAAESPPLEAPRSRRAPRARSPRRAAAAIAETAPGDEFTAVTTDAGGSASIRESDEVIGVQEIASFPTLDVNPQASQPDAAEAQEQDPARPKRSGWWQRAKATLRG